MKPIIGITSFDEQVQGYHSINNNYVNAVFAAGGIPVSIPTISNEEDYEAYIHMVDGLIFSGGIDISPLRYGENPLKEIKRISTIRDEYEFGLFDRAYKKKLPILGICRGLQLMNIYLGGSLYQDISRQLPNSLGHCPDFITIEEEYHSINIRKGTRFHRIFDEDKIYVNSYHHQGINRLGENLKVAAVADDGLVEAVEAADDRFLIGVQFHPEALLKRKPKFLKLFEDLVMAAKDNR
ncbi:MAG: gamma-glutamyl-gamma-aminobutyrate hydrolase family protein [Tissierellia bacterium]|nr:gamma-glutamyl-gamma-aminobutyrate hydrolase family protein [Tissierellia bacterium]